MDHHERRRRFEELIASTGGPLAALTPRMGLELILRFCEDDPRPRCLTSSWGAVNQYGREEELGFRFHLHPHALHDDDFDSDDWTLDLRFKFVPHERVRDLQGGGMVWGFYPEDLGTFLARVEESSPAFQALGRFQASEVAFTCGDAYSLNFPLFDCWGVRDPSRPVVSMTEEQWLTSDDASLMLRWFRQQWRGEEHDLDRLLHRYCLACCRKIWRLLPHEASRAGVEVAERYIEGLVTSDELGRAEYEAEAGAFTFDHDPDSELIARWTEEASKIPREELDVMIHSPRPEDDVSPGGLLKHAAYFADHAIDYPFVRPKESIERYRLFLSVPLLRGIVGNPFRFATEQQP